MTYAEKLLDPRWQKKRLEILNRESFTCQLCGDTETTLHIHHEKYHANPWDTDNSLLKCYCKHCHSVIEFNKKYDVEEAMGIVKDELPDEAIQIHFAYLDGTGTPHVDIYAYEGDNKLRYITRFSEQVLYYLGRMVFKKAEAP